MSIQNNTILLVDDDSDTLEFLTYNLEKEDYIVHTASNGYEAIKQAVKIIPDLIILDVMMPGMDGVETCTELRNIMELKNTVISFLTARGEDYSHVVGLEAGADDYIVKPIKPKILVSKVKSLLRRNAVGKTEDSQIQQFGNIIINRERYLVVKDGTDIVLPRKEFELISYLSSNPGKVFTRDDILKTIWGEDVIVGDRTIDVHIRKLREKLGNEYFKTIKGVGYKFEYE
ncbi:MAG: response regulator transcription factor [Bacteroidetes bacterium]|jgi:two-component system, OmpR family, alkaline phosphatase synthesis response regulator PhoP|nr:response regulator transcription factor [Bacteroidota bacterium]MBT5529084.1 response regulator transcription factor [Cytophagia bacterium]MBT3422199.1 response regulator transcription factor [Bacteroidota bacterium]MBT3802016.1 response regulator transcription factor [Bacteroidota bacterium]MBT4339762.1 response regulator transcription factor [Bacteroidota bacterium]